MIQEQLEEKVLRTRRAAEEVCETLDLKEPHVVVTGCRVDVVMRDIAARQSDGYILAGLEGERGLLEVGSKKRPPILYVFKNNRLRRP